MLRALLLLSFIFVPSVYSHGMTLLPVNRASRWRFNSSAPINWDDNELFCGGISVQWEQNNGNCGLCGDNYADRTPRRHEIGGKFGEGVIVEKYKSGSVIPVQILIVANHMGYFKFSLCNIDIYNKESEECFDAIPVKLANGDEKFVIENKETGYFNLEVRLPPGVLCEHCVFRWHWRGANNWGQCENGDFGMGCGPQETFRTCSDVSIHT